MNFLKFSKPQSPEPQNPKMTNLKIFLKISNFSQKFLSVSKMTKIARNYPMSRAGHIRVAEGPHDLPILGKSWALSPKALSTNFKNKSLTRQGVSELLYYTAILSALIRPTIRVPRKLLPLPFATKYMKISIFWKFLNIFLIKQQGNFMKPNFFNRDPVLSPKDFIAYLAFSEPLNTGRPPFT